MASALGNLARADTRAAGVSDAAYLASGRNLGTAMMKAMNGSCTNIAVLLEKYDAFCKRLSAEGPNHRMMAWIACIREGKHTCGGPELP